MLTKRSLLCKGTALASLTVFSPATFLVSRTASAQEPVSTAVVVYQAVVAIIGALNSQKFSRDVRSGLDDIKAQLNIIDQKIEEVLQALRNLPAEIQKVLENNNREEAAHRIRAFERSLTDEFAEITDITKISDKKKEIIRLLVVQLKTEGYYLAEWGPLGYAFVARAFADCVVAFTLLREGKAFLRSFGEQYLSYMSGFRDSFIDRLKASEAALNQNQKEINDYPKVFHLGSFKPDCTSDVVFDAIRSAVESDKPDHEPHHLPCSNQYTVYFGDLRMGENGRWTGSIGSKPSNRPNPDGWPSPPGVSPAAPDQMHYQAQEILNAKTAIVRREEPIANGLRPHAKAATEITAAIQEFVKANHA